jgi:hypothetical protein
MTKEDGTDFQFRCSDGLQMEANPETQRACDSRSRLRLDSLRLLDFEMTSDECVLATDLWPSKTMRSIGGMREVNH